MRKRVILGIGVLVMLCSPATPASAATPPALPWETVPGGRRLPLAPAGRAPGFATLEPAKLGITWTNHLSPARYSSRQNLMNGAGVALADVDGDGWCDLYLCNKEGPSALYRNLGNWKFEDITERAGVGASHLVATGAVFADVNGDGRPDLFVTSFLGPDALYLNLGDGRFTNVTTRAGVASKGGTTSAAFADVDGDGDLDLYVCHFGIEAILRDGAVITTRNVGGQPVVMGRFAKRLKIVQEKMVELGEPDVLLLNDGQGNFTASPWSAFTGEDGQPLSEGPPDFGLCVLIRDLDGNGTPDIYVCNDFQTPDQVWLGDGKGRFRAPPRLALRNMSYASMGVDCADLGRRGQLDIFTVEMLSRDHARNISQRSPMDPMPRAPGDNLTRAMFPRNVLQHARGDGTYAEVAWFAGVAMSDWSWTPIFVDVDLDGFEDLLVSNGHMHDVNDLDVNATRSRDPAKRAQETAQQILLAYPRLNPPKAAWRNRGNLTFEDRSEAWGFHATNIVHGMALADLDNDGDPDVVGNEWNEPPLICRNDSPAPRVAVRLRGAPGNPQGIGARVRVRGGPVAVQEQEMRASGRYLSCDQPQLTFATGSASTVDIEVTWRNGTSSRIASAPANSLYEIDEAGARRVEEPPRKRAASALLTEAPVPAEFTHEQPVFDDLALQPLLPWRMSRTGPGLAAIRDGQDTVLVLGAAQGGRLKAVRVTPDGHITSIPAPGTAPLAGSATALCAADWMPGRSSVMVAISPLESGLTNLPSVLRFDRVDGGWKEGAALPPTGSVPGALAAGDLDGDGDPDLVVAGRWIPGRYPEPASVQVYRNDAGALVPDPDRSAGLRQVGMVTAAAIADMDGDGRKDLALACEWGPVRLFLNTGTSFKDATAAWGLENLHGIWQSLVVADFDQDGRPDLAVGNWGRNSYHQRSPAGPWELWYGDFTGVGRVAIVEAHRDPVRNAMVPFRPRDTLASDLPWLKELFPSNHSFGEATVAALFGSHAGAAKSVRATTLASMILMNRGGKFEATELPAEAQWTPVHGLAAPDLDHDGRPDLVCSQNLFAVRDEDDALDAGRGLVLRNDPTHGWVALSAEESGVAIYGDQRAVVAGDFDGDGKADVAISQNGGPLKVWLNRGAQ